MAHPRRPRQPQRTLPSFLLALLFHAALFGALTLAVNWRTESEAPAVAELWGAVPPPPVEVAPAPPPPPPPPPKVEPEQREADIALKIEQKKLEEQKRLEEQRKLEEQKRLEDQRRLEEQKRLMEQKRLEEQKKLAEQKKLDEQKKLAEQKEQQKEQRRLEAQREAVRKAEQERMLAQAGGPSGGSATGAVGGTGRRDAGYADMLKACIRPHLAFVVPEGTSPEVYAQFRIEVLPSYELAGVKLVKPSGLAGYDAAAERAIRRCDPIPRPRDGKFERTIVLDMKPVESKQ